MPGWFARARPRTPTPAPQLARLDPGTTRPPNRRIDYVYVSEAEVAGASVPPPGDEGSRTAGCPTAPVPPELEVPDTWPQGSWAC